MFTKHQLLALKKFILTSIFTTFDLFGLPQGGVVVEGEAGIESRQNYMQINQSSNSAIINWQSFNIGAGEHTHFQQPSSSAITINRVNGANGSSAIFGKLTATGQIFLLNPSGVLFGPNSQINVGSILASTSDINMTAYTEGRIELLPNPLYQGSIINHGNITVSDGGYVAFAAPHVANHGVIRANLGHVHLASGDFFTVDLFGDGLIHLKVPEDSIGSQNYKIEHDGKIYADGGSVLLTAADADHIVSSVINMDGLVQANSIADINGKIVLSANKGGSIKFAANSKIKADGGYVKVSAKDITLTANSSIDVSSKNDNTTAGQVYIGGNYQGQLLTTNDFNATTLVMDKEASILANAFNNGDGGKIVLWSDGYTQVAGLLHAQSGINSGNGGLIETSGKYILDVQPTIDVNTASLNQMGNDGTWLLDPIVLVVDSALATSINTALLTNNVTITTNDAQPPILNQSNNSALIGGYALANPALFNPNIEPGDVVLLNVTSTSNNTPITWNTKNKFSIIAADDIHFGLPATDGNTVSAIPLIGPAIISTGGGGIHLQTNSDGTLPIAGNHSTFGSFYDYFHNTNNSSLLPLANTVVSSGGGLVELYSDHNPNNAFFTWFTDPQVISSLTGSLYNGFVNVSGGSQLIDYQLVYNQVNGRTMNSITAPFYTHSFALNENITLGNFAGLGGGISNIPFTGNFDGLNHSISNLVINNFDNSGLFNETDSSFIGMYYAGGSQYFKNIRFNAPRVTAALNSSLAGSGSGLTPVSAGVLIGSANISNETSLNISNISIQNANVAALTDIATTGAIYGKAGGLIGSTTTATIAGINNSTLNIDNIRISDSSINSSYIAAGLLAENTSRFVNITGPIHLDKINITSILNKPIANNITDGLASSYAAGLIGKNINFNTDLNANSEIVIIQSIITAQNEIADHDAYAGGLIANFRGIDSLFDQITLKDVTVSAKISRLNNSPLIDNKVGNQAYAGGLIAHNQQLGDLTVNGPITIQAKISATIDVPTESGSFKAYAGGLFGNSEFIHGLYNDAIFINTSSFPILAEIKAPTESHAYAGGLSGRENYASTIYNGDITTFGATAINNQNNFSVGLHSSSMAGGLSGYTFGGTEFNGAQILINSLGTGVNSVVALSHGEGAVAYAGGLYGLLDSNQGIDSTLINSEVTIKANILTTTFGDALNTSALSSHNIMSGGLAGVVFSNDITINAPVETSAVTSYSQHAPLHSALQATGGLFGGLVNAGFIFDDALFSFHNTAAVTSNNHSATNFIGAVIGYVDVQELHPSTGITHGEIHKDALNDGADWDNGAGNFHYTGSNEPCQGPSAGLCNGAPTIGNPPSAPHTPSTATEVFHNLPEHITHSIENHASTTSHSHDTETHSHAPHVPHNDHRSHHTEESEFTATFSHADYKDLIVNLGYPGAIFMADDENLFFAAFEFQGHHGFSLYHQDEHGDFSRVNTGGEHH